MARYGFKEFIGHFKVDDTPGKKKSAVGVETANKEELNNGVRLRLAFEELGPAFIKIGQILSTRTDILPENYIRELTKLQDKVTPIEATEALNIIEEELKIKVADVFAYFDEKPMAVASIGQVHRAKLYNGDELVLKVKKRNIEQQLALDLQIVQRLSVFLEKRTTWGRFHKISELASELCKNIMEELDYKNEGRNADRFSENFRDDPDIYIPNVYWKYTTRNVLALEYQSGYQLNRILENGNELIDRNRIADSIVESYFNQIFIHGFFHGDPHPGNIIVLPDGRIMFVDFGAAGYINEDLKQKFRFILKSIIFNRNDDVVDGIINLGFAPSLVDREELASDINRLQGRYFNTPLDNIEISEVLQEFVQISYKHTIHLPSEFLLMVKTLGTLEGIVSQLNPGYRLINALNKFGKNIEEDALLDGTKQLRVLFSDYEKLLSRLPAQINTITESFSAGDFKVKVELVNNETPAKKLGKYINRLSLSIVFAALIIAFSLLAEKGELLFFTDIPITQIFLIGASLIAFYLFIAIIKSDK